MHYKRIKINIFNQKHLVAIIIFILISFIYIEASLLMLFLIIDHVLMRLNLKIWSIIPFDFWYLGTFLLSYFTNPLISLIFLLHGFFIRFIYGTYSKSHILKLVIFLGIIFITSSLKSINLFILGSTLYILRYLIEYLINLLFTRSINFDKITFRLTTITTTIITLVSINNIIKIFQ